MGHLSSEHIAKIEKQSDLALQGAFLTLCDMEVDLEWRLEVIREIKSRTLIEIEARNYKRP